MTIADPVGITIKEGSELKLQFEEPATPGSYEEIRWYKGSTGGDDKIVHFRKGSWYTYYGDYCSGISPCDVPDKSDKGELDTTTGTFTIHQVKLSDTGYYYYYFYTYDTDGNGQKYEYTVDVSGKLSKNKTEGYCGVLQLKFLKCHKIDVSGDTVTINTHPNNFIKYIASSSFKSTIDYKLPPNESDRTWFLEMSIISIKLSTFGIT